MIYPIVAFGDPVLKARAKDIPHDFPADELKQIVQDMYDTMYYAHGVGLAAPQVGKSIRLFVIDSEPMIDTEDEETGEPLPEVEQGVKQVFINPQMVSETGEEWGFQEGCLSIPGVREMVYRHETILIRYEDENRQLHEKTFSGMTARVIQHEYDHLEGVLFTDKISGFKKQLIKGKLTRISKGDVNADYRMRFAGQGRR
ncbi:peptide deformylase [Hymenobacter psychrotolerans]|uniref:Peptide deformylase n=1 Tax=Hymenobacter psychrotolerans DSM 18569 TaxID=1121959 RepID=A0A1M7FRF5_9BACT|nr:peptide deformylase [Hymenobacter psychrotolerans]SHM06269.1 peptide deformylase [Hymenobacter psychrotolerans DSM 18569]